MPLTNEQANSIKEQIFKHIENFPEDKKIQIKEYISSLNNDELEEFIIKNNLIKNEEENEEEKNRCIMCLIAKREIESFPIYEDENFLAVLEINPVAEGHTLFIPKKHIERIKDFPRESIEIEKKIASHLKEKLGSDDINIVPSEELGHAVVNIIPIKKGQKLEKREQIEKEKLEILKKKIGEIKSEKNNLERVVEKTDKMEKEEKINEETAKKEIIKLSRRVP